MAWKEKLKQEWNDNPLQVIAVGAATATAATMVLNALSAAQSRRAYSRQVNYKLRNGL
jgi:hypothetical protein